MIWLMCNYHDIIPLLDWHGWVGTQIKETTLAYIMLTLGIYMLVFDYSHLIVTLLSSSPREEKKNTSL